MKCVFVSTDFFSKVYKNLIDSFRYFFMPILCIGIVRKEAFYGLYSLPGEASVKAELEFEETIEEENWEEARILTKEIYESQSKARKELEKLTWPKRMPRPKSEIEQYLWTFSTKKQDELYFQAKYHQAVASLRQGSAESFKKAKFLFLELIVSLTDKPGLLSQERWNDLKSLAECGWINAYVQNLQFEKKSDEIMQIAINALAQEHLKPHVDKITLLIANDNHEIAAAACNALGLYARIKTESGRGSFMNAQAYFYRSLDLVPYWPDTYFYLAIETKEPHWLDSVLKLNPDYEFPEYAQQIFYSISMETKDINRKWKLLHILVRQDPDFRGGKKQSTVKKLFIDTSLQLAKKTEDLGYKRKLLDHVLNISPGNTEATNMLNELKGEKQNINA